MSLSQSISIVWPDEIHASLHQAHDGDSHFAKINLHHDDLTDINILTRSVTFLAEAAHELLATARALADDQHLTFFEESDPVMIDLDHLLGWWRAVAEGDPCPPRVADGCQGFGCLAHLSHPGHLDPDTDE